MHVPNEVVVRQGAWDFLIPDGQLEAFVADGNVALCANEVVGVLAFSGFSRPPDNTGFDRHRRAVERSETTRKMSPACRGRLKQLVRKYP